MSRMLILTNALIALTLMPIAAQAVTIGTTDLDAIVVADPFHSGGSAGNTVQIDSPGTFFSTTNHSADNLWASTNRFGAAFGLGSSLGIGLADTDGLEAWGHSSQNEPALRTTVTGLVPSRYDVYAVFVTSPASITGLDAALTGDPLATYVHADVTDTTAGSAGWNLSIAKLGTTPAGATGFSIDVDDLGGNGRSFYIGAAYAAVPEPASIALWSMLGVALTAFGLFRNRK